MIAKILEDETGDVKLPIPTAIMNEMRWSAGDVLCITKVGKTLHLTKIIEETY